MVSILNRLFIKKIGQRIITMPFNFTYVMAGICSRIFTIVTIKAVCSFTACLIFMVMLNLNLSTGYGPKNFENIHLVEVFFRKNLVTLSQIVLTLCSLSATNINLY